MGELADSYDQIFPTRSGDLVPVFNFACGCCAACTQGWSVYCAHPAIGDLLCAVPRRVGAQRALTLLMVVSAFLSAAVDDSAVVLAASEEGNVLAGLLRCVHKGSVLVAPSFRNTDVKVRLAQLSSTGRADVIVTSLSGRDAVMVVKRGGVVCLPRTDIEMPSVTELAQREVRIFGPQSVSAVVKIIGRPLVESVFRQDLGATL